MFELAFLGTGASTPSVDRNLTSTVVIHEGQRFLIDCGEGTQRQLLRSGLGFRDFQAILFTHGHLDHILGIGGLMSTFRRWGLYERLQFYGSAPTLARIRALMRVVHRREDIPPRIEYVLVSPGPIITSDRMQVEAFPVVHYGGQSFGYLFRERDRRPFLVEKAERLGVPPGPERGRLVRGESVTLADGRMVRPDQVLGQVVPGTKLVYVGDAGSTESLLGIVKGADCLIIEATYTSAHRHLARRFDHLTAAEAAALARRAGVGQLILNHISRRYSGQEILAEARSIFPRTVVARDLDRFRIVRREGGRQSP